MDAMPQLTFQTKWRNRKLDQRPIAQLAWTKCPLRGQKQTCALQKAMSALPPKADMCSAVIHVCFEPIADMSFNIQTKRGRLLSVAAVLVRRLRQLRLPLTQTGHLVSGIPIYFRIVRKKVSIGPLPLISIAPRGSKVKLFLSIFLVVSET